MTGVFLLRGPWPRFSLRCVLKYLSMFRALLARKRTHRADVSLEHHAVSIPLAIGVDYRVTSFLSVGPSFELAINNPVAGCVTTSAVGFAGSTYSSNSAPKPQLRATRDPALLDRGSRDGDTHRG